MTTPVDRLSTALAGRYAIDREIGAGGMATVYLAEDTRHRRKVAIKVLHPELSAVLGPERFLKEIELTANLQHPHILPLYDSGSADNLLFYVMPYVEGETLRQRLTREHQLPIVEALRIATDVADALEYAHKHGVVHRDIKPENVLLHEGRPMVADFGIALAVQQAGGERMTQTGMSLGTPQYMAPEQAMGDKAIDHRADIYALGAVTYEMLTGEPPFTGANAQAVVAKILTTDPSSLVAKRRSVPAHVESAVLTALEKIPADRFASAKEFSAALGEPGRVPTRPSIADASRPSRSTYMSVLRGRYVVGLAIVLGGMVAGWAAGGWWKERRSPPPPVVDFTLDVRFGGGAPGTELAMAADGSQLVYVGENEQRREQLMIRRLSDANIVAVPGGTGNLLRNPAFSPDGEQVAFYADQRLRIVHVRGGGSRALARMSPTNGGITWAPDGRIVFQPAFGRNLSIIGFPGGEVRELTKVDTGSDHRDHRWPHALPDGRSVLFTIWRGLASTASIGIASLSTGEVRELLPGSFPRYSAGHLLFVANGALQAVPFDVAAGKLRGTARTVLDSVSADNPSGGASFGASVNGSLVLVERAQSVAAVLADLNGKTIELGMPAGNYQSPRFSPRGSSVAVGHAGSIWVRDLALGTFGPLTSGNDFYPIWSADGRRIYYSREVESDVHVYSVAADRSTEAEPLLEMRGQFRTQALSPDGRHLLLRINAAGELAVRTQSNGRRQSTAGDTSRADHYDLWLLTLDSASTLRRWLSTDYLERAPAFSPNGRWVAYSSDESGRDEIYVRPFPGPGGRSQISMDGGSEPAWMPDGQALLYRTNDAFMRVPVRTADNFEVTGPPLTLFRGSYFSYSWSRQYDVHPDGQRLVLLKVAEETSDLRVIVNWPGRVSARESAGKER